MKSVLCVLALLLVGCKSAETTLNLIEMTDAATIDAAKTARVEPLKLPGAAFGDLDDEDQNWQTRWPGEGAEQLSEGLQEKSGRQVLATTTGNADLVVTFNVAYIDVGYGGKRYWGSGASRLEGTLDVAASDGRSLAKFEVKQSTLRGYTGLAYHRDCLQVGEELGRWLAKRRR